MKKCNASILNEKDFFVKQNNKIIYWCFSLRLCLRGFFVAMIFSFCLSTSFILSGYYVRLLHG